MTIAPPDRSGEARRLDAESFQVWYKDFSSRMERTRAEGDRVRAALHQTYKALRQTLDDFGPLHHRGSRSARRGTARGI